MCCLSVWQLLVLLCTCYVTRAGGRSCVGVMGLVWSFQSVGVRGFYGWWGFRRASKIMLRNMLWSSFKWLFLSILHKCKNILMCWRLTLCFVVVVYALCYGWGGMSVSVQWGVWQSSKCDCAKYIFVFIEPYCEASTSLPHIRLLVIYALPYLNKIEAHTTKVFPFLHFTHLFSRP